MSPLQAVLAAVKLSYPDSWSVQSSFWFGVCRYQMSSKVIKTLRHSVLMRLMGSFSYRHTLNQQDETPIKTAALYSCAVAQSHPPGAEPQRTPPKPQAAEP